MKKVVLSAIVALLAFPSVASADRITEDTQSNDLLVNGCAITSVEAINTLIDDIEIVFPPLSAPNLGLVEAGTSVKLTYDWDLTFPEELTNLGNCHLGINALFSYEISDGPLVVGQNFSNVWSGIGNLENMPSAFEKFVNLDLPEAYVGTESIDQTLTITIDFQVEDTSGKVFDGAPIQIN